MLLLQIGEIATRYQLHTSLPSRSELHIRQKFQWTSKQLKSAYLDLQYFHRRSSKFPAEHLFFVVGMTYSRFYRHNSCTVFWVSSFHLSVNILVLYHQFTVPGHVYRKLRIESWSVKSLGWKKGSRLWLCFQVVDDVPEKKGRLLRKLRPPKTKT